MKVIFLKDVGGVGRAGEMKDISDGYVMNFLIPKKLVEQATAERIAIHAKQQEKEASRKATEEARLKDVVLGLRGARIELKVRATEKGGLFKSIGPKEVVQALKEQKGVALAETNVHPLEPIKAIGDHIIKISLPGRQAGAAGAESEVLLKIVAA